MTTVAIVLAAGEGKRMGAGCNKVFLPLAGKPVLAYSLEAFDRSPCIDGIIVVGRVEECEKMEKEFLIRYPCRKLLSVTAGGATRQQSVWQGLQLLPAHCTKVAIHDGARPLVTAAIIERVLKAVTAAAGAIAAVPVKDTIKQADVNGFVTATPDRSTLWAIQTPQAFDRSQLVKCYAQAQKEQYTGTDDASLVERYGGSVQVVQGSYQNIKITTPEDIPVAVALLQQMAK